MILFVTLTSLLQHLIDLDTALLLEVNSHHSAFFDVFMPLYSGKWVWMPFYISLAFVIARNYSWKATILALLTAAVIIVFSDQVSAHWIRPEIERLRPSNLENPISETIHIVNGYRGGSYSFPSAHAANSWALVTYIILLFRRRWLSLLMVIWAVLMCYSRMYLGVHYMGDLLAGMAIGAIGALILYWAFSTFSHQKTPARVRSIWAPIATGCLTVLVFLVISAVVSLST